MYVADAHCDFLYYMLHREYDVAVPRAGQAVDIPGMRAGGAAMQLFAAWMDPDEDVTFLQQWYHTYRRQQLLLKRPFLKSLQYLPEHLLYFL